jgi:hypothetical protein
VNFCKTIDINTLVKRYEALLVALETSSDDSCKKLMDSPERKYHAEELRNGKPELCKRIIEDRHKRLLELQSDLWNLTLPGLVARITVFDLGIVGQIGLLLLLLWFFYAARRENHAIRSLVDIKEETERNKWFPHGFTLTPQEASLSAEHYAYAYQAVAQRFVFIFSTRTQPLLVISMALFAFPSLVTAYNWYVDLRDLFRLNLGIEAVPRLLTETLVFVGVLLCAFCSIRHSVQSSVILNAWHLAIGEWEREWDETNQEPARPVKVDRLQQKATLEKLSDSSS